MTYRHRQVGWPIMIVSDVLFIIGVVLIALGDGARITGIVLLLTALVVALLSVLTVTVDATHVTATFFPGWPKHRIALADISSAEAVRNKTWWGFGIRKVPGGWMYNVGGLDAVEVVQHNGKRFRIGTNDVEGLERALATR
ncbi:hypothetical protein [Ilumatobacter coccineus]|jgi:hypothetical protein|uniref:Uncharacterized protein n=1 Tax=Ilumatobacter coccineus (strain NBRC 103263 / KCTC 29153 / YM16-304) TaxID=1313172 RepID=A0A6C7DYR8_ILUCY|nr:hypothetical protein [Ilumatobacter coccineus]BAN00417.1 hypothetical protein YM304_01030 [Ilumatobacter coccineus YM16-304]